MDAPATREKELLSAQLHSKRWGNNIGRYGQEDRAVGSLNQALPANPVHLGASVHQELEQQMPSSDIPSKILWQVIKIDLQDMQQQTPCQQLIAKDLHGNEWNFQHVNQRHRPSLLLRTSLEAWNAQNGGAVAILVLDYKNEPMITMDTPEEENADADYLLRCIRALYTFCPCWRLHQDFKEQERNCQKKIAISTDNGKDDRTLASH
ncbi:hypothetical protein GH714_001801 [Hevea brasiliensis]|uniref:Uncharacterized protein n=1 Tax=Hevea brasiliensis TaxID=3981 RepID=A0A6A6M7Y0_HEVBR|nr:hypothetical protein GH714_001801 [Hevea brasiliensis]